MTKPLTRQQNWRRKNPRRYLAHLYVQAAKRVGILAPQPCEQCGATAEAHHPDYDRPGDVQWLCRKHHRQLHAKEGRACETADQGHTIPATAQNAAVRR